MRKLSADKYYGNIVTEVQPSDDADARPSRSTSCGRRKITTIIPTNLWARPTRLTQPAVFKILKPGGTFMIIDHMAKPGRGLADTEKLHRIDPAIVRKEVEAAGFKFAGESKVLEQSRRPARHPGVRQVDPRPHQPVRLQVREAELGRLKLLFRGFAGGSNTAPGRARAAARRSSRASAVGQLRETTILLSGLSFAAPFRRSM